MGDTVDTMETLVNSDNEAEIARPEALINQLHGTHSTNTTPLLTLIGQNTDESHSQDNHTSAITEWDLYIPLPRGSSAPI